MLSFIFNYRSDPLILDVREEHSLLGDLMAYSSKKYMYYIIK